MSKATGIIGVVKELNPIIVGVESYYYGTDPGCETVAFDQFGFRLQVGNSVCAILDANGFYHIVNVSRELTPIEIRRFLNEPLSEGGSADSTPHDPREDDK